MPSLKDLLNSGLTVPQNMIDLLQVQDEKRDQEAQADVEQQRFIRGLQGMAGGAQPMVATREPQGVEAPQLPAPKSEMEKLMEQMQARQLREAANRSRLEKYLRGGAEELEGAVKAPQDDRTDLSPLMALSDTWFGGNLSKGYRPPPTKEEKRQQGLTNLSALQQRKEALAEFAGKSGPNDDYLKTLVAMQKDQSTKERTEEKKVSELSSRLEKSGLSGLDSVIADVNATVPQEGDIPGVGQTGFLPDALISQEGKNVRNSVASLRNIVINARSGQAVSESEAKRMLEELGMGATRSDEQLKTGIRNVTKQLAAKKQGILAGYKPSVGQEYSNRGGNISLPSFNGGTDAPPPGATMRRKRPDGSWEYK